MKRVTKIVSFLALILMIIPLTVKAEDVDLITVTCESNEPFKVGTTRKCDVTIHGIANENLLRIELDEGLTTKLSSANDDYSIEFVQDGMYLIKKSTSVSDPAKLTLTLSLASDANIKTTGVELKLYTEYNKILLGDLNSDGTVSLEEALKIEQASIGAITLPEEEKKIADIDQDGEITVGDSLLAFQLAKQEISPKYLYEVSDKATSISSGPVVFDVDCTPNEEATPPEEKVDVPDTASNLSVWIYAGGAVLMAFGVYLIIQSRKTTNPE